MSLHPIEFEWDDEKAKINLRRHNGVSFEEAETVFGDPFAHILDDPDHSLDEERAIIIGYSQKHRLLFVSFAARGNVIRIISARQADLPEREIYEEKYD
jgi:hypothetical protein